AGSRQSSLLVDSPYSPEFRLVATCAMWPPSDRRNEGIHAAASGPLDCSCLVRVAARQRVIELVHDAATCADSFLLAGARLSLRRRGPFSLSRPCVRLGATILFVRPNRQTVSMVEISKMGVLRACAMVGRLIVGVS